MSSDLYTSEIDSKKYGGLYLEMKVDGNLRIVSLDPGSEGSACFTLPPNPEGWREAENLIAALHEWVNHTKELEGVTKGSTGLYR